MTTGNDVTFKLTLDRLSLDSSLPIEFAKIIDRALRTILKANDPDLSLHDLIVQARDAELLSDEAIDLAHTIRKQRNIIAHRDVENQNETNANTLCSLCRRYSGLISASSRNERLTNRCTGALLSSRPVSFFVRPSSTSRCQSPNKPCSNGGSHGSLTTGCSARSFWQGWLWRELQLLLIHSLSLRLCSGVVPNQRWRGRLHSRFESRTHLTSLARLNRFASSRWLNLMLP